MKARSQSKEHESLTTDELYPKWPVVKTRRSLIRRCHRLNPALARHHALETLPCRD